MSASYEGPAVLVDDVGTEIEVTARLGVFHEYLDENFGGPFLDSVPGWKWWGGLLEADAPIRRSSLPCRLRMPDGRESRVFRARLYDQVFDDSSDSSPNQVEVKGEGEAPWDWET